MTRYLTLVLIFGIFAAIPANGQQAGDQIFMVHEDVAKISRMIEYENELKQLNELSTQYSFPHMRMVAQMNGNRFLMFSPVESLDKMAEETRAFMEKVPEEDRSTLIKLTNSHLETHSGYMIIHSDEFSYIPNTADSTLAEQNYRVVSYNYMVAGKEFEARELLRKWKSLYEEKEIPYRYDVFFPGLGMDFTLVNIMWSGRDGEHVEQKFKHVKELLGDSASELQKESLQYIRKTEEIRGVMRPDLDYYPSAGN